MRDSPTVGTIQKCAQALTTIDEWRSFAPPKRSNQWQDGRSAKENARAWISALPYMQRDIAEVLANCPEIVPVRSWIAEPEAHCKIDGFRGEQPNIDLLLLLEDDRHSAVVAIEAKADEPFGSVLADQYRCARAAQAKNPRSKAVARIDKLLDRFAVEPTENNMAQLRYQLLTATAAVLLETKRRAAELAVLLVHEFVTPSTVAEKRARNDDDLQKFLAIALKHPVRIGPGEIAGPIPVNDAPALYVGKARTVV